jgi:hypothetical protein
MDGASHLGDAFQWSDWQTKLLDSLVITSCSLSILGSLFIFLSYALWRDLRTTPRLMLVCLSFADLVTASGWCLLNLFIHLFIHFSFFLSIISLMKKMEGMAYFFFL